MGYILTGATMVSGTYVSESGAEVRYTVTRGQDVTTLGLPSHIVKELVARKRKNGGRRVAAVPYFTHTTDAGKPVEVSGDAVIDTKKFEAGLVAERVAVGAMEPDVPVDPDEGLDDIPQPEVPESDDEGGEPATTADEAEVAVEEPAAEPVVSPDDSEDAPCENPDCAAGGDTGACEDDNCPMSEAPVEADEEAEDAPVEEAPAEEAKDEEAAVEAKAKPARKTQKRKSSKTNKRKKS